MLRKKRSSSNPPVQPAVASSATSAAALAFLNKRASDASLSASAAAAALRSHTTSPQPIGAIQTKRMIRKGSVSSVDLESPVGSLRQSNNGGIQRSASSASMRDRSFRSPSPYGRKAPTPLPTLHDEVPPVPQNLRSQNRSVGAAAGSNSGSSSTPLTVNTSATSSYTTERKTIVKYDPHTRTVVRVPVENRIQSGNPGSPRSVNFSRPMSPPVSYNSSAREQVRQRPASSLGHSIMDSARDRPPMPQGAGQIAALRQQAKAPGASATTPATLQRPGSSAGAPAGALVAAAVAARPTSAVVAPGTAPVSARASAKPVPARPSSVASVTRPPAEPQTRAVSSTAPPTTASASAVSAATVAPRSVTTKEPAAAGPSPVEIASFQNRAAAMLARPLTDSAGLSPTATNASPLQRLAPTTAQASETPVAAISKPEQPRLAVASQPPARTKSVSPSRTAHFGQSPVVENLRHQPPPRDLSPAKSALKAHSRPSSPAGSRISETSSVHSDDGNTSTHKKKKSVRVSFDENAVLVGEASSPMTPASTTIMSPQYKRDPTDALTTEDDGMYAPRPALPSFGSVRSPRSPAPLSSTDPTLDGPLQSTERESRTIATEPPNEVSPNFDDNGMVTSLPTRSAGNEPLSEPLPSIAVLPATPRVDESKILESAAVTDANAQRDTQNADTMEPTVAAVERTADVPEQPIVASPTANSLDQSGELSPEDQFSDAAEDPSQFNVDGGANALDSILESPFAEASSQPPLVVTPKEPSSTEGTAYAIATAAPSGMTSQPTETEDWERIRRYWNSLSEQRKQELELEAGKNVKTSELTPAAALADSSVSNGAATATTRSAGQPPLPPWPDKQYQTSVGTKPSIMKQTMRTSHQRAESEPTHMRTSMRENVQSSAASKERIVPPPRSAQRPVLGQTTTPAAGADTTAAGSLQAAINAAKPKLERTLSNESSASESSFRRKRGTSITGSDSGGFSMKRTMRGGPPSDAAAANLPAQQQSNRFSLRPTSPPAKKGMSSSLRESVDSTTPTMRATNQQTAKQRTSRMGFGKSSKPTSRFKSRFNDSSGSDDETMARSGFRSRFDDSDDEADGPSSALRPSTKLTPVRGIPKKSGQVSGNSTDLDDSDDDAGTPNIAALVASNPKNIPAPAAQSEIPSTPTKANGANGTTEGKILKTGTLRTDNLATSSPSASPQASKPKRTFFGLGRKKQALTESSGSQPASPVAAASSPIATNAVPSNNTATQGTPGSPTNRTSRFRRRLSSSGDVTATNNYVSVLDSTAPQVPPIPPVPDTFSHYAAGAQGVDSQGVASQAADSQDVASQAADSRQTQNLQTITEVRPKTAEGVEAVTLPKTMRPMLGAKRESAMTAPVPGSVVDTERSQIVSERTGKKKKFQGLRRMLGVHN